MNNSGHCGCDGGGSGSNPFNQRLNTFDSPIFGNLTLNGPNGGTGGQLDITRPQANTGRAVERFYSLAGSTENFSLGLQPASNVPEFNQQNKTDFNLFDNLADTTVGHKPVVFASPAGSGLLLRPSDVRFSTQAILTIGDDTVGDTIPSTSNLTAAATIRGNRTIPANSLRTGAIIELEIEFRYINTTNITGVGFNFQLAYQGVNLFTSTGFNQVTGGAGGPSNEFDGKLAAKIYFQSVDNTTSPYYAFWHAMTETYAESYAVVPTLTVWNWDTNNNVSLPIVPTDVDGDLEIILNCGLSSTIGQFTILYILCRLIQ